MLSEALVFLKDSLNAYLTSSLEDQSSENELVVFLKGQEMASLNFAIGRITLLLINIEEERQLRPADLYTRIAPNGHGQHVHPEIRLNLHVLFVAHFEKYEDSLQALSHVIQYFQRNRRIDHHSAPTLSEGIEKLVIELITQSFAEQNEVWNALRVTYHPSVLYKVGLVVFHDEDALDSPRVSEPRADIRPTDGI